MHRTPSEENLPADRDLNQGFEFGSIYENNACWCREYKQIGVVFSGMLLAGEGSRLDGKGTRFPYINAPMGRWEFSSSVYLLFSFFSETAGRPTRNTA